jgi:hypothetical protein
MGLFLLDGVEYRTPILMTMAYFFSVHESSGGSDNSPNPSNAGSGDLKDPW